MPPLDFIIENSFFTVTHVVDKFGIYRDHLTSMMHLYYDHYLKKKAVSLFAEMYRLFFQFWLIEQCIFCIKLKYKFSN